jgi:hypothetical protein
MIFATIVSAPSVVTEETDTMGDTLATTMSAPSVVAEETEIVTRGSALTGVADTALKPNIYIASKRPDDD